VQSKVVDNKDSIQKEVMPNFLSGKKEKTEKINKGLTEKMNVL
jgi:hypothetical protein